MIMLAPHSAEFILAPNKLPCPWFGNWVFEATSLPVASKLCAMFGRGGSFMCPAGQQGSAGGHQKESLLGGDPTIMEFSPPSHLPGSL